MKRDQYQAPHLSFFPELLPAETAYSVISRFHQRSGFLSAKSTLRLLFGEDNVSLNSDIPCVLRQLSQLCHVSIEDIVHHHTIIPFYSPFLTSEDVRSLLESIAQDDVNAAYAKLSLPANRLASERCFKACPACFMEDIERYGVSYWHSGHQLPGISCCAQHANRLMIYRKGRNKLFTPTDIDQMIEVEIDSSAYRYSALLTDCFQSASAPLKPDKLYQTYYYGLKEKGFLTKYGRIRQNSLRIELYEHWQELFSSKFFEQISPLNAIHNYPGSLFYSKKCTHHPIKHLLLIGFLFSSWSDFIKRFDRIEGEGTLVHQDAKRAIDPLKDRKRVAKALLSKGKSLQATSRIVRISVTTLRCLAEREGLKIAIRPKFISKLKRRSIWRKLMIGKSTKSIAKSFGVSVSAVELVLRSHTYLIPLRRRIRYFEAREKSRLAIKNLLLDRPTIRRIDIQKESKGAFMWLYRHDREWLNSVLPPAIPFGKRYLR